ncbi:polysaccharide deacetylase family protein, partial [Candidatus Bathyarchaeota archaeon]|nr:polysaccharide deacetylase family protein [Candidatus Bathyarchaeota archaeon]
MRQKKLTDVIFIFEIHQPHRIRQGFFWERHMFHRVSKKELFDYYFDQSADREIFERACRKCYLPSNMILLQLIDKFKKEKKKAKFSFSVSGVFIEQCERYAPDVLELFKQLAETGYVEFLDQTYYHSVVSLYPTREEFIEEVRLHRRMMKDLLNKEPSVFENTELLYNNAIAKEVESLGYDGIVTEG